MRTSRPGATRRRHGRLSTDRPGIVQDRGPPPRSPEERGLRSGHGGCSAGGRPMNRSVDMVLPRGAALAAGALLPGRAARGRRRASVALLVLLRAVGRASGGAVVVVVAMMGGGALARGVRRRARTRAARARPTRRSVCRGGARARAHVESSPVRARDVLRWDARLEDLVCDGDAGRVARPRDPLRRPGRPRARRRGRRRRDAGRAAAPVERGRRRPEAGEAHRGVVRSGGTLDVVVRAARRRACSRGSTARAPACAARIDATFAARLGAHGARARARRERPRAGRRPRLPRERARRTCSPCRACTSCSSWPSRSRALRGAARARRGRSPRGSTWGASRRRIGMPVAWVYAEFAGAGGSTVRAAWMVTAVLLARALGRRTDATRAFGLSLVAMALARSARRVRRVVPAVGRRRPRGSSPSRARSARAARGARRPRGSRRRPRRGDDARGDHPVRADPRALRADRCRSAASLANLLAVPVGETVALPLCLVHALLAVVARGGAGCARRGVGRARARARRSRAASRCPALTSDIPPPTSWQLAVLAVGARGVACCGVAAARRGAVVARAAPRARAGARRGGRAARASCARRSSTSAKATRPRRFARRRGDARRRRRPRRQPDRRGRARRRAGAPRAAPRRDVAASSSSRTRTRTTSAASRGARRACASASSGTPGRARREGARRRVRGAPRRRARARRARRSARRRSAARTTLGGARVEVLAPCPAFDPDRGAERQLVRPAHRVRRARDALRRRRRARGGGGAPRARPRPRFAPTCSRSATTGAAPRRRRAFLAAVRPREAVISAGVPQPLRPPAPAHARRARRGRRARLAHGPRRRGRP